MAVKRPDPKLVKVIADLQKLGYVKVVALKKNVASVYVPKSDRAIELKTIAKKMRGKYDTSGKAQNAAGSSIGGVYLKNGMIIGAKPDASKSLNTDQQETLQGIFIAAKMMKPATKFFLGRQNVVVCQRSKSKFVTNISNAATKLIRESGKNMGIDKWNPADIWLVKKSFLNHDFKQYTSIIDLNEFIYESYKSKDIVGVSLKATKKKASVKIFNDGIKQEFKYESFKTGASYVKAMGNEIFFTGGKITFRLFGKPADVIGEINGKHAAGGKVGGGPLFRIMREFDKKFSVPAWKDIMKMYETKPEFVVSHLYKDMQKLAPTEAGDITEDQYAKAIEEKGNSETYVISKWHANEVIHSFQRMKKSVRDDCIAAILGYASSSTEISSIFIKVS